VQSPFEDWSWPVKTPGDTSQKHGGSASYSFTPANYNAIYFYNKNGIQTSQYSGVTFWIYRVSGATDNINFALLTVSGTQSTPVGPKKVTEYLPNKSWPVGTWVQATVNFKDFTGTSFAGLWVQYQAADTTTKKVYVDDVVLVKAASTTAKTSTTTAKSSTTTGKAATTTTGKAATTTTGKSTTTTTTTTGSGTTGGNPSAGDQRIIDLFNKQQSGDATYYGVYSNGGNCMLDPTPTAGSGTSHSVAIATPFWYGSATCGMCISVSGNGVGLGATPVTGTRTVFVNNQCPSCPVGGDLDFALSGDGVWDITWKAVACPVGSTKIQYVFKEGSSTFWLGLQARNTKYPVYKFELLVNNVWTALPRQDFNYFVQSFSAGLAFPVKIRLTSALGHVVEDQINAVENGKIIEGKVQF